MSRHETVFCLRYATVVLERHAALWSAINTTCRIASLLAGSAVIAGLGAQNQVFALVSGVFFAVAQSIEFATHPADKAATSRAQARQYAKVWASQSDLEDGALERAYRNLVADDAIKVSTVLKDLAYNQTLREMGCDDSAAYPESRWHRLIAFFA